MKLRAWGKLFDGSKAALALLIVLLNCGGGQALAASLPTPEQETIDRLS
jgi:hypothetical protein